MTCATCGAPATKTVNIGGEVEIVLCDACIKDFAAMPVVPDIGRNDPCPCGSGKKFKKCCEGKTVEEIGKEKLAPLLKEDDDVSGEINMEGTGDQPTGSPRREEEKTPDHPGNTPL